MKATLSLAFSVGLGIFVVPAMPALASQGQSGSHRATRTVFGRVASTASSSFVVNQLNGSSANVHWTSKTRFYPKSSAAAAAGLQSGDSVVAKGYRHRPFYARTVTYDTKPFVFRHGHYYGTYSSNTGSGNGPGTLTITSDSNRQFTVNVDTNTQYQEDGQQTTNPTYASGDDIGINAGGFTDGTWLATFVDIETNGDGDRGRH